MWWLNMQLLCGEARVLKAVGSLLWFVALACHPAGSSLVGVCFRKPLVPSKLIFWTQELHQLPSLQIVLKINQTHSTMAVPKTSMLDPRLCRMRSKQSRRSWKLLQKPGVSSFDKSHEYFKLQVPKFVKIMPLKRHFRWHPVTWRFSKQCLQELSMCIWTAHEIEVSLRSQEVNKTATHGWWGCMLGMLWITGYFLKVVEPIYQLDQSDQSQSPARYWKKCEFHYRCGSRNDRDSWMRRRVMMNLCHGADSLGRKSPPVPWILGESSEFTQFFSPKVQ